MTPCGVTPWGDKREIRGITQNCVAWSLNVETLESLNKHFCLYLHSQWGKYPLKPAWVHKAYIVGWMNIFCLINLLPSFCHDLTEGCDVQYFFLRFLVFMQFSTFSPQVHLFPNFPDTFTEQWVYFAKLNHPYFFTLSQTQQSWESRDSRKWGQKSQLITLWRKFKFGEKWGNFTLNCSIFWKIFACLYVASAISAQCAGKEKCFVSCPWSRHHREDFRLEGNHAGGRRIKRCSSFRNMIPLFPFLCKKNWREVYETLNFRNMISLFSS